MHLGLMLSRFHRHKNLSPTIIRMMSSKPPNILVYTHTNQDRFQRIQRVLSSILDPDGCILQRLNKDEMLKAPWVGSNRGLVIGDVPQTKDEVQILVEHFNDFLDEKSTNSKVLIFLPSDIQKDLIDSQLHCTLDEFLDEKQVQNVKIFVTEKNLESVNLNALRLVIGKGLGLPLRDKDHQSDYDFALSHTINFVGSPDTFSHVKSSLKLDVNIIPRPPDAKIFDVEQFRSRLSTAFLGSSLIHGEIVRTTFDLMDVDCQGLTVVADRQTGGRGRSGNTWLSPHGALLFSFQLKFSKKSEMGQRISLLCQLIPAAVVKAIHILAEDLNVRVKWPNDIYFEGIKVGGVMILTSFMGQEITCNVGCGINLNNEKPTMSLNRILAEAHLPKLKREDLIAEILNETEAMLNLMEQGGKTELIESFCSLWIHQDAPVTVQDEDGHKISGTIMGIDEYGFLRVKVDNSDNNVITVQPDGNSFDLMQGLIAPKWKA